MRKYKNDLNYPRKCPKFQMQIYLTELYPQEMEKFLELTKSSKAGRYLCHELLESMITTISNHANSYLTSCCKQLLQSLATEHNISGF